MKKENVFIDLSKCSEEEIKNIALTLKICKERTYYNELKMFKDGKYYKPRPHLQIWGATDIWGCDYDCAKTELLYSDFIKLFDGVEDEKKCCDNPYIQWNKIEIYIGDKQGSYKDLNFEFCANCGETFNEAFD